MFIRKEFQAIMRAFKLAKAKGNALRTIPGSPEEQQATDNLLKVIDNVMVDDPVTAISTAGNDAIDVRPGLLTTRLTEKWLELIDRHADKNLVFVLVDLLSTIKKAGPESRIGAAGTDKWCALMDRAEKKAPYDALVAARSAMQNAPPGSALQLEATTRARRSESALGLFARQTSPSSP